jgi:hypothetical protein
LALALALAVTPPDEAPLPELVPPLPGPAETGGGAADAVALQPFAAVSTSNRSGCPVKVFDPPAVIVIVHRPLALDVATVELPLASAGASKTT